MMATSDAEGRPGGPATGRSGLVPILKGVAALLALLVLLQAFLAGRFLYLDPDLRDVHRYVGMAVVLVALLQVALVFVLVGASGLGRAIFLVSAAIFILTIVQLSLGFSGRDSTQAAAWHVFNGVLIFGLVIGANATIFRLRR